MMSGTSHAFGSLVRTFFFGQELVNQSTEWNNNNDVLLFGVVI